MKKTTKNIKIFLDIAGDLMDKSTHQFQLGLLNCLGEAL